MSRGDEYVLIRDVPVARDVLTAKFCCNLGACKGACCVEGESGAPLTPGEAEYLQDVYPQIRHKLRPEAVASAEIAGPVQFCDGWETTLVGESGPCVFAVFENDGTARCALEAHGFNKPISCKLYPIREERRMAKIFLRYEKWGVCKPARNYLGVPLVEFLRDALVQRFGQDFYDELVAVQEALSDD